MDKNSSIKSFAIRLLSRREFSRLELEKKISRHYVSNNSDANVQEILEQLEKEGYLSEERYVGVALHSWTKRYGKLRILSRLKGQCIRNELIEEAEKSLQATEFCRAEKIWQKKFGAMVSEIMSISTHEKLPNELEVDMIQGVSAKNQRKQASFLASRGFSSEIIRKVLKKNIKHFKEVEAE